VDEKDQKPVEDSEPPNSKSPPEEHIEAPKPKKTVEAPMNLRCLASDPLSEVKIRELLDANPDLEEDD